METNETRRWKIERSFDIDTKWAESAKQGAERLVLGAGALLLGFPAYLKFVPGLETNHWSLVSMVFGAIAFACGLFAYLDAMDAHGEASLAAYNAIEDDRLPSIIPLAMDASNSKRGGRTVFICGGFLLLLSVGLASVYVVWQTFDNAGIA
ncbi:MAG: hypothetical protein ABW179_12510 [Methylobacterium sp.]